MADKQVQENITTIIKCEFSSEATSKLLNSHCKSAIVDSNLHILSESNNIEEDFKSYIQQYSEDDKLPHNIVPPEEISENKQESAYKSNVPHKLHLRFSYN